jgi:hypothetical protein
MLYLKLFNLLSKPSSINCNAGLPSTGTLKSLIKLKKGCNVDLNSGFLF